jgi:hypothetical protein
MNPDEMPRDDIVRVAQYRGVSIYRGGEKFFLMMPTVDGMHTLIAESVLEAENIINAFMNCK